MVVVVPSPLEVPFTVILAFIVLNTLKLPPLLLNVTSLVPETLQNLNIPLMVTFPLLSVGTTLIV